MASGTGPGEQGAVGRTVRRLGRLPGGGRRSTGGGRAGRLVVAAICVVVGGALAARAVSGFSAQIQARRDAAAATRTARITAEFASEVSAATFPDPFVVGPFGGVMVFQRLAPGRTAVFDVAAPPVPAVAPGSSLLSDVATARAAATTAGTAADAAAAGYLQAFGGSRRLLGLAEAGRADAQAASTAAASARRALARAQGDRPPAGVDGPEAVLAALRAAEYADISSLRATAAARRTESLELARERA